MKYLLILGLLMVGCVRKELTPAQTQAINSMDNRERALYDSCIGDYDNIRKKSYCLASILEKK